MTDDRDLTFTLEAWLREGPDQMPDRVADVVRGRIGRQAQRPSWTIDWKLGSRVDPRLAFVAVIALVVVAVLAIAVIGRSPSVVPPVAPSTRPSQPAAGLPSATRSARPTPSSALGPGLVVFEHYTPGKEERLEYLAPDRRGIELLPGIAGVQHRPAWSPDGTHLVYAGVDPSIPSAHERIDVTDSTGSPPVLISTNCQPPDCLEESSPSYAPDGRTLVFVRVAGTATGGPTTSVVAIRDLATGNVTTLESTRLSTARTLQEHPRLSPDGRSVLFTRVILDAQGAATDAAIFIVDLAGGKPRQLTPTGFEAGDAEWSPDGSRILFARELVHYWFGGGKGAGSNTWIYTMAADGTDQRQLTNADTGSPSWTAAGTEILFIAFPTGPIGTPDFKVMAPDGSDVRSVATYGDCCRWYPVQQPTP
jgi:WD40 repeat protein